LTGLAACLRDLVAELRKNHAPFAVIGGFAVSARTEPRFTRDVDLAVAVGTDGEAESLVRNLNTHGFRTTLIVENEALNRLAMIRLARAPEGGVVAVSDLLFASSGIESDVASEAEPMNLFEGLVLPVARTGHLVALKLLSNEPKRPQDAIDLRSLRKVASDDEFARAQRAVRAIADRGCARGRDLAADLAAWWAASPTS
jgi:hypothetical protein